MMTIEVTTYEEETVGMRGLKLVHVFGERDLNGVITVWWTGQHTYKHEVGAEGKPEPELFLSEGGSEGSAWRVRSRVFDEESNSSTRARLRSVKPEEGVTRERYLGVRHILGEESFC